MSMLRADSFVLPGMLAAGCAALAWFVTPYLSGSALELVPTERVIIETAPTEMAPDVQDLPQAPIRLASIQSFSATINRPIFSPNRRSPKPPVAVKKPVLAPPFDIALKGIIFSPESKFAVVSPGIGDKTIWLTEGDEYRGWKLAKIKAKEAAFLQNRAVKRLFLDYDGAALLGNGGTPKIAAPIIDPRTQDHLRPLRARLKSAAAKSN